MTSKKQTGDRAEGLAVDYLEQSGYLILDRNYRFERAEIDIVCFELFNEKNPDGELVFVEVKSRSGPSFGRPEEAVTTDKQQHIAHAAQAYLYERKLEGINCRFDVISILFDSRAFQIEHIKDAFWS